jgi:hypothetical protein
MAKPKNPQIDAANDRLLNELLPKIRQAKTLNELTAVLKNNQDVIANYKNDPRAEAATKEIVMRFDRFKSDFKTGNINSPSDINKTYKQLDQMARDMTAFAAEAENAPSTLMGTPFIRSDISNFIKEQQKGFNTAGTAFVDKTRSINNFDTRAKAESELASNLSGLSPSAFFNAGGIQSRIEQNRFNTQKDRQKAENAASFYDVKQFGRSLAAKPYATQVAAYESKLAELPSNVDPKTPEGITLAFKRHDLEQKLSQASKGLTQEGIYTRIANSRGLPVEEQLKNLSSIAESDELIDPRFSRIKKAVNQQQGRVFQEEAERVIGAANQRWGIENNKLVEYSPEQRNAKVTAAQQQMTAMLGDNPVKILKEISDGINVKVVDILGKNEIDLKKQAEVAEKIAAQQADRDQKIMKSTNEAHPLLTAMMKRKDGEDPVAYADRVGDRAKQIGAVTGAVGALAYAGQAAYGAIQSQRITAPLEVTQMRYGIEGQKQSLALQALSFSPEAMVRFGGMYGGLTGQTGNSIAKQLAKQQTESKQSFDQNMGLMGIASTVIGGGAVLGGLAMAATGVGAVPGLAMASMGAGMLGSSLPSLAQNPFYQQYGGEDLAAKGAATYEKYNFDTQQSYIEAEMRKQQINIAKMGQYQTGLEAYSSAVDMVGSRAINPTDLAMGLTAISGSALPRPVAGGKFDIRTWKANTNYVSNSLDSRGINGANAAANQVALSKTTPSTDLESALQKMPEAYLSQYGVNISDYSRKAAQFSSVLGKGSVGRTDKAMQGLYGMGLAGVGSFDQLLGNTAQMNAITGKADSSKDLREVLKDAVKTGFDTSRTGQAFVQSTIALSQATGINNVSAAGGLLSSTAALMGGRERDLMLAQQGIAGQSALMTNPAVGGLFNVGFMTSGNMKDPMRNVLYGLNQSPAKAKQAQNELTDFQKTLTAGGDSTAAGMAYIKAHPELTDEARSLIRSATTGSNSANAASIIANNITATGKSNSTIGMFVKSLGGSNVQVIKDLDSELSAGKRKGETDAQWNKRRDSLVYKIQGATDSVAAAVGDVQGFDMNTGAAFINSTLSESAKNQIKVSSGKTTLDTMESRGKEAKRTAAQFDSLRANANTSLMGLGATDAKKAMGTQIGGLLSSLAKGGQNYQFSGSDFKQYEIEASRAQELLSGKKAAGSTEEAFVKASKEEAGKFGARQAMSNLDMGENVQKVQVMNFDTLIGHLSNAKGLGMFGS